MTETLQLQHTRGVPLRNVCLLCVILQRLGADAPKRELMLAGRDLGLHSFESVKPTGNLPTRVRHHQYALQELELVDAEGSSYSLTNKGEKLAEVAEMHNVQPVDVETKEADVSLPGSVRSELRQILCSSKYVRHWWLRYFVPIDDFSLTELVSESRDVIIELLPPEERIGQQTEKFKDSGYRVHSYFPNRKGLRLDESGRREIHEGLRQWSIRLQLVSEVVGWDTVFEIEDEFLERIESRNSRLDRAYIVQLHWGTETPIKKFEALLSEFRAQTGGSTRIRIPELVVHLALQKRFSLRAIHKLLHRLYRERQARYFFESASRWLLTQPSNPFPLESYVQIDGAWRTSIVFTGPYGPGK